MHCCFTTMNLQFKHGSNMHSFKSILLLLMYVYVSPSCIHRQHKAVSQLWCDLGLHRSLMLTCHLFCGIMWCAQVLREHLTKCGSYWNWWNIWAYKNDKATISNKLELNIETFIAFIFFRSRINMSIHFSLLPKIKSQPGFYFDNRDRKSGLPSHLAWRCLWGARARPSRREWQWTCLRQHLALKNTNYGWRREDRAPLRFATTSADRGLWYISDRGW